MFAVMDENTGGGVPQFATAEYGGSDAAKPCKACGRPLSLADPMHGLIGLVILFVGIRIAWQLTAGKKLNIVGPLNAGAAAAT
jgi:hypothetical protein